MFYFRMSVNPTRARIAFCVSVQQVLKWIGDLRAERLPTILLGADRRLSISTHGGIEPDQFLREPSLDKRCQNFFLGLPRVV
jgi:hypothetical protein